MNVEPHERAEPIKRKVAASAEAVVEGGRAEEAAEVEVARAVVRGLPRKLERMARRFWNGFQKRPVAVSTKYSKKQTVDQVYARIAEELRTQYSLGYTPDKANVAAGYHKISLTTKQKNLAVQTRDGYYAER
jgi:hypothetical protein